MEKIITIASQAIHRKHKANAGIKNVRLNNTVQIIHEYLHWQKQGFWHSVKKFLPAEDNSHLNSFLKISWCVDILDTKKQTQSVINDNLIQSAAKVCGGTLEFMLRKIYNENWDTIDSQEKATCQHRLKRCIELGKKWQNMSDWLSFSTVILCRNKLAIIINQLVCHTVFSHILTAFPNTIEIFKKLDFGQDLLHSNTTLPKLNTTWIAENIIRYFQGIQQPYESRKRSQF
ncbi:hypothetical protein CIRG_06358 [Coccidioides immitis RMSCC 2394]|uniref:Uncharacterized protein n=1 Tax=Coccidioides immitis RMSCC 2394 TaxID=404692 RepID=A0A0J7B9I7_COCIT|nr:hypothetical protein CIRG_06358 [Coccidioides immitis RMSCC 2394]